jgi:hypothetical protein
VAGRFKGRIKEPEKDSGKLGVVPEFTDPPEQRTPAFSLRYLQSNYCITKCQKEERAALADTMYQLSQLTWGQIKSVGRHALGAEKIPRNQIKAPIPSHITDDVDFLSFRFYGKAPMVGYRREATFFIVWLDRDYTLYNH